MAMNDRRRIIQRKAWSTLLLVLALSASAVIAAWATHTRMDWTEDRLYTLSDSTLSVLAKLDEPLMIRAYVTAGLPQPYGQLRRFIEDMLRAYHDAGGANIGFELIDPTDNAAAQTTLTALNVPRVRVQVVENDQAQVKQGYLALVLEYLDKKEVIPVVQGEQGFEYLLTTKIRKLSGKDRPVIGVVKGFGATTLAQLQQLQQLAGEDYAFVEVDPAHENIPEHIDALIVDGVEAKPDEAFRYRLDQFRLSGRGIWILTGHAKAALQQGITVRPLADEGLAWLQQDFGIVVDEGLVLDRRASRILVNQQQGMFMLRTAVDYPFLLHVTELNPEHEITRDIEGISMPFASPLQWQKVQGGMVLASSSPMAAVQAGPPFDVDPMVSMHQRFLDTTARQSQLILAYEGMAETHFPQAPEGVHIDHPLSRATATRLLVSGSPSLLDDEFMDESNLLFVLNALDWLGGEDEMIALRSRGATQRPLAELDATSRNMWKILWMFGLPGIVVLAGLLRWQWLRKRRSML